VPALTAFVTARFIERLSVCSPKRDQHMLREVRLIGHASVAGYAAQVLRSDTRGPVAVHVHPAVRHGATYVLPRVYATCRAYDASLRHAAMAHDEKERGALRKKKKKEVAGSSSGRKEGRPVMPKLRQSV